MGTRQEKQPLAEKVTDLPLPGNYPCLTLQLNVTRYASQQLGRYVIVVRDPNSDIEVAREIGRQDGWVPTISNACADFIRLLGLMRYLQDGELTDTEGTPLLEP